MDKTVQLHTSNMICLSTPGLETYIPLWEGVEDERIEIFLPMSPLPRVRPDKIINPNPFQAIFYLYNPSIPN